MKETKKFKLKGYDDFEKFIKEKEMFGWEYVSQQEMVAYGKVEYYTGDAIITGFNVNKEENYALESRGISYLEVTLQREKNSIWYEEVCKYEEEYTIINRWYRKGKDNIDTSVCKYYSIPCELPVKPVFDKEMPKRGKAKYILLALVSPLLLELGPICIGLLGWSIYKAVKTPGKKKYNELLEQYQKDKKKYEEELKDYNCFKDKIYNETSEKVRERKNFIIKRLEEIVI